MPLQNAPLLQHNSLIHTGFMQNGDEINRKIIEAYTQLREPEIQKRTHFFGGRYENLYLQRESIPAIAQVLHQAEIFAAQILKQPDNMLRSGFWINDMGPNQVTSEHDHDEYDELLSGVYYVQVPNDSGDLIVVDKYSRTVVSPRAGMFVFFAPSIKHSVTKNLSQERRISIGMNFGPA